VIAGLTLRRVRGCSGRTSSTWMIKKVLASKIVLGALSSVTVGGTFALLNSQESNAKSSIASGTLTFSNVVNTGAACFSYGGAASPGNVNNACTAIFTSASLNYPGTPITQKITLTNNGSLDAADLTVYMPSCTNATTPGAPAPGGGNPCASAGAELYIQETTAAWVATTCRFPAAVGACAFNASSLSVFNANYNAVTSSLDLGSGPAHGAARYFIIGMRLPTSASNTLQGQAAQFGLTWLITS
jgi:predicted ribosomally synthesized peptide with SipW-like signal peptide